MTRPQVFDFTILRLVKFLFSLKPFPRFNFASQQNRSYFADQIETSGNRDDFAGYGSAQGQRQRLLRRLRHKRRYRPVRCKVSRVGGAWAEASAGEDNFGDARV